MAKKITEGQIVKASLLAISLSLLSCKERSEYCGESFCVTKIPDSFYKEQRVDFNIYRLTYRGKTATLYEGNHPSAILVKDASSINPRQLPDGFIEGRIAREGGKFSAILRTPNPEWPAYVVVSSHDPKELERILTSLRARKTTKGFQ